MIDPLTKDKKEMKTNMIDYFMIKYKRKIEGAAEGQPLLIVNFKDQ